MANDHQIYISSLDFSPKSQTHKFISTWIAFGHLKINRSKTELRILRPMLHENGNDHTNQFSSELSGFILDLCLSHPMFNLLINPVVSSLKHIPTSLLHATSTPAP